MKKIFHNKWLGILMMGVVIFSACTHNAIEEVHEQAQEETKNTYVATINAGLKKNGAESRLSYKWVDGQGVKMRWSEGDQLTVNALPNGTNYAFTFDLKEGKGTANGIFECTNFQNYVSTAWTIYYPGSSIKCDKDYMSWSYTGQTQIGNNNMNHLKDKHSIRMTYYTDSALGQSRPFEHAMIDFSAEGVEQSSCMKFNLSGFSDAIVPNGLELVYYNPQGAIEKLFYECNIPSIAFSNNWNTTRLSRMALNLEGFASTQNITAYMLMSNATMSVNSGGKFRIYVTTTTGRKYFGDVSIKDNVDLKGGNLYTITCKNWTEADQIDAFNNPSSGVTVLQEATEGNGTDIIIMGDGFDKTHFDDEGDYDVIMRQAYDDFFRIEPYRSLRQYFNVYYVNAVSEEDHDAIPDKYNGATQGIAKTVFNTQLRRGSTSISGNDAMVLEYAMQAIRTKGGKNGTPVEDENEVYRRAHLGLMMVQVNVKAHAGTCLNIITSASEYGSGFSVAYTALGTTDYGRIWTTIHEAGGHGFGKLADEYEQYTHAKFDVSSWKNLENLHSWGYNRNVHEYWEPSSMNNKNVEIVWGDYNSSTWPITNADNVYWSSLLSDNYAYKNVLENTGKGEGLGVYEGGFTFDDFYCRPTENSVMRSQFDSNGHFFNAISRWAIWYRVMKLTGKGSYANFASSLDDFIKFDNELDIVKDESVTRSMLDVQVFEPLAPPVLKKGRWINGRLILE